jgi:hypothetical protein
MCKFGYPFKIEEESRIEFKEEQNSKVIRGEIALIRNDEFMNMQYRWCTVNNVIKKHKILPISSKILFTIHKAMVIPRKNLDQ